MPEKNVHNKREVLKGNFKDALQSIVSTPVSVTTITTFASDALDKLIDLIDTVVAEYKKQNKDIQAIGKELENIAFKHFGLQGVGEILEAIIETDKYIQDLAKRLEKEIEQKYVVIIPPQEGMEPEFGAGGGAEIRKRLFSRLLTLVYVLERDFELGTAHRVIKEGFVRNNQMRDEPYVRVEIPSLDRVVYVCDEEGNATYIFDTRILREHNISIDELDTMDKGQMQGLIAKDSRIGIRLIMSDTWRYDISRLLEESFGGDSTIERSVRAPAQRQSEFIRKKFLPWDEFVEEVRDVWDGIPFMERPKSPLSWYREEAKKHPSWPHPRKVRKMDSWVNWRRLVGLEIPYEEFEEQVRREWSKISEDEKPTEIAEWYKKLRLEKQKNGECLAWPGNPYSTYHADSRGGNRLFVGWRNLVGLPVDKYTYREKLPFSSFIQEVRKEWEKVADREGVNVAKWYDSVAKEHLDWPNDPSSYYSDDGWKGFSDFLSNVRVYRPSKEVIDFATFKEQVRREWDAIPDAKKPQRAREWYKTLLIEHPDWPKDPYRAYYSDYRYESFSKVLGIEENRKVRFTWDAFEHEVRVAWKNASNDEKKDGVVNWYKRIYKQHQGWPSPTHAVRRYKDSWQGWLALVNPYHRPVIEDYDEFAEDVRRLYEQAGKPDNIYDWYDSIPDKENRGWISVTRVPKKYKDEWKGWPALVGKDKS